MIAVDTNVLVRFLIRGDDAAQHARAIELFRVSEISVLLTVVLEAEWVLRANFRLPSDSILDALTSLAGLPSVVIQQREAVLSAIGLARQGLDFADALHLTTAADVREFVTFDREFVRRAAQLGDVPVRVL